MFKIVVTQNLELSSKQVKRLKSLGEVTLYNDLPSSYEEWMERCKDADIICTGKFGFMQKVYEMKDKFFSLPFVNVKWLDKEKLKDQKITAAYTPGGNKEAVTEWVMGMLLILFRKFPQFIGAKEQASVEILEVMPGLAGKKAAILGKGHIGKAVGKACKLFKMKVRYFQRGDNLLKQVKNAEVIINCLSTNEETIGLLNKEFFEALKKGAYFITFTDQRICNDEELIKALDNGTLTGAAHDAGSAQVGDTNDLLYTKLLNHPKLLATPHVAFNTEYATRKVNEMMIDNVEAWIKGKPINLI